MKALALITSGLVLIACGDDAKPSRDTSSETADTVDTTMPDPDTTTSADSDPTEVQDTAVDVEPEVVEPHACDEGSACNMLLDDEGNCPGACFEIPDGPRCEGEVIDGLCFRYTPFDLVTSEADFGDFVVTPVAWPAETTIGETSPFEVRVTNKTNAELTMPFAIKDPTNFTFTNASWDGLESITIAPHGTLTLSASATAMRATVFQGAGVIVTFQFGERETGFVWDAWSKIDFAVTEPIACAGRHFPETWCLDPNNCYAGNSFYMTSKCCDDVFYPSAQCCTSDDCVGGGGCIDGKCVRDIPALNSANTVPVGNQRVLLVLIEQNDKWDFDPCADRSADISGPLQLDKVDAWFDELAERRFGHSTLDLKWEVRTGMTPAQVLQPGDPMDGATFLTRIDEYMQAQGCGPVLATYDKLIVASPEMDLGGYGGIYGNEGHIVTRNPELPYLLTHELTHSYGAFDLYIDLGGQYQYWSTLMGNNVVGDIYPGDDVAWGEVGYADHDFDGVIDVAQFAAFPETFEIADKSATLTTKNTLEITWRFVGKEDGVAKDVIVTQYELTVPNTPARVWFGTSTWRTQVYGDNEVDLDALRAAGSVTAHLKAELRFTGRDWQRVVKTIDEDMTIPIIIED